MEKRGREEGEGRKKGREEKFARAAPEGRRGRGGGKGAGGGGGIPPCPPPHASGPFALRGVGWGSSTSLRQPRDKIKRILVEINQTNVN